MSLPWWITKKEIYNQVIKDVACYSCLRQYVENSFFTISGSWPVHGDPKDDKPLEDFLIKIIFPNNYPDELPKVYETGNRIKVKNANTHFYNNYSACLFYPTERYLHFPENDSFDFKKFLEGPVKSFFFSQLYYIYHNKWPFGQRSHDIKGLLEFYAEKLSIPNNQKSISIVLDYLLKPKIKGHWPCPCGNDKLRDCHVEKFRFLHNKIPSKNFKKDFLLLMNHSEPSFSRFTMHRLSKKKGWQGTGNKR